MEKVLSTVTQPGLLLTLLTETGLLGKVAV